MNLVSKWSGWGTELQSVLRVVAALLFMFQQVKDVDFVRGAAAEATRGVRVNVVSPPWVSETLVALKMDPLHGLPAAAVARAYVAAVTGRANGETLDPTAFA